MSFTTRGDTLREIGAGCFRGAIFFKQPDLLGIRMSPSCPDVQALNTFEPRIYRMNTNKTTRRISGEAAPHS